MKIKQYSQKIAEMHDDELTIETKDKIWSSTFWIKENHESHDEVSACYSEWRKRKGDDSIYKKLHQEVRAEFSH